MLFAGALRETFKQGYSVSRLRRDVLAGVIVGLVAIPLAMAFAIAVDVPPQHGLYTAIFAGFIVALLGGSRFQITGPTAAFVVILLPIVHNFGLAGLMMAGFLAGILLIIMGLCRLGDIIRYIPHPVTTGFTSAIALVIATLQLKDFLGLHITEMPEAFVSKVITLATAAPSWHLSETIIGIFTLAFIILCSRYVNRIVAPIAALVLAALLALLLQYFEPSWHIDTIASRFTYLSNGVTMHGIPSTLPSFDVPWLGQNHFAFNLQTLEALLPSAFTIAMLAAIESLLSACAADGMTRTHHNPNSELIAQGVGNMVCPFFGGIPATGAIVRTATNIRFGAYSPIAAMTHAIVIGVVLLLFAKYVSYIPMAALAALLLFIAYNMADLKQVQYIFKIDSREDKIIFLTCFLLTAFINMTVGVAIGVVLAALLFMHRVASMSEGKFLGAISTPSAAQLELPNHVELYEIAGPMFFGAAEKAISALSTADEHIQVVIIDMSKVPIIDLTGLVALETALIKLHDEKRYCILSGLNPTVNNILTKSHVFSTKAEKLLVTHKLSEAIEMARQITSNL